MRFHVVTIFPEFFSGPFAHGVVARAQAAVCWIFAFTICETGLTTVIAPWMTARSGAGKACC